MGLDPDQFLNGSINKSMAGPIYTKSKVTVRQVTDGMSKTLAVGERHIRPVPSNTPPEKEHFEIGDTAFSRVIAFKQCWPGRTKGCARTRRYPRPHLRQRTPERCAVHLSGRPCRFARQEIKEASCAEHDVAASWSRDSGCAWQLIRSEGKGTVKLRATPACVCRGSLRAGSQCGRDQGCLGKLRFGRPADLRPFGVDFDAVRALGGERDGDGRSVPCT